MKRVLILALGMAAVFVGGNLALATNHTSEIRACVHRQSGAVRIAAQCRNNEDVLTWNTQGPAGAPGISGYEVVSSDRLLTAGTVSFFGGHTALCPDGKKVLGGGVVPLIQVPGGGLQPGASSAFDVKAFRPLDDGSGFVASVSLSGGISGFRVYATCATMA